MGKILVQEPWKLSNLSGIRCREPDILRFRKRINWESRDRHHGKQILWFLYLQETHVWNLRAILIKCNTVKSGCGSVNDALPTFPFLETTHPVDAFHTLAP